MKKRSKILRVHVQLSINHIISTWRTSRYRNGFSLCIFPCFPHHLLLICLPCRSLPVLHPIEEQGMIGLDVVSSLVSQLNCEMAMKRRQPCDHNISYPSWLPECSRVCIYRRFPPEQKKNIPTHQDSQTRKTNGWIWIVYSFMHSHNL